MLTFLSSSFQFRLCSAAPVPFSPLVPCPIPTKPAGVSLPWFSTLPHHPLRPTSLASASQCPLAGGQSVNSASLYHASRPLESTILDNKKDARGIFSAPPDLQFLPLPLLLRWGLNRKTPNWSGEDELDVLSLWNPVTVRGNGILTYPSDCGIQF